MTSRRYFPGNLRALGNWFPHHELQVVFSKAGDDAGASVSARRA
jgi:hypothetical protein